MGAMSESDSSPNLIRSSLDIRSVPTLILSRAVCKWGDVNVPTLLSPEYRNPAEIYSTVDPFPFVPAMWIIFARLRTALSKQLLRKNVFRNWNSSIELSWVAECRDGALNVNLNRFLRVVMYCESIDGIATALTRFIYWMKTTAVAHNEKSSTPGDEIILADGSSASPTSPGRCHSLSLKNALHVGLMHVMEP